MNLAAAGGGSNTIVYKKKPLSAAACRKCGAKIYPKALLEPHLYRHQRQQRWYLTELGRLQNRFARM